MGRSKKKGGKKKDWAHMCPQEKARCVAEKLMEEKRKADAEKAEEMEKEEEAMMEQQQLYLKRFTENVPEMKRKIQKKILA